MNQYGPRIATVSLKTLEKWRDVMEAMRALAAQEDGQIRQWQADVAALRRDLEVLRDTLPSLVMQSIDQARRECGLLLRSHLQKYSPDQPRVPAGNRGGGEWTNEGDGESSADRTSPDGSGHEISSDAPAASSDGPPEKGPQYAALDTGTATDATAGGTEVQVASGPGRPGYPIDLQEDEGFGHTIRDHVGKSEDYLLSVVRTLAARAERLGDMANGLREGSFPSLEAANKLVNSTVGQNQSTVNLVVSGTLQGAQIDADFPSPTGYEAFARTERSTPYIRPTYGVHVVIARDQDYPKGYRVVTAFPVNR